MKAHHLYSTATTLATAVLLAAPSLADQTISDTQTKAVNMTEGKLTVTGTGFLNVAKNAVNLKDPIQSALEIEVMEGGRISGKSALVLDQGMENGITGQLISVTNSGTMTGTEKQAIDLRYMINTSATITNNGTISAGQKGAVKLGNNATVINNGTIEKPRLRGKTASRPSITIRKTTALTPLPMAWILPTTAEGKSPA